MISSHEVSERLSDCLGLSADEIQSALARGCSRMSFNQSVWNFARTQRADGRNLALVTGNADIFREVIVPSHGLDREFDSIVCCSDFGVELPLNHPPHWDAVFDALGPEFGYANSLLIEDTRREVDLFRDLSGTAYQYRNDQEFDDWLNS